MAAYPVTRALWLLLLIGVLCGGCERERITYNGENEDTTQLTTSLKVAISIGDRWKLESMLEGIDDHSRTALEIEGLVGFAIKYGAVDLLPALIAQSETPILNYQNLPLPWWVLEAGGSIETVDQLVSYGIPLAQDPKTLRLLASTGRVDFLAQRVGPVELAAGVTTMVVAAVATGRTQVLEWLRSMVRGPLCDGAAGQGLVAYAVARGEADLVRAVIDVGCDIEEPNQDGISPLGLAASRGDLAAVQVLCRNGAGVESRDPLGYSPLMRAAVRGHLPVARALVAAGASASSIQSDGLNAARLARLNGQHEVADWLEKDISDHD